MGAVSVEAIERRKQKDRERAKRWRKANPELAKAKYAQWAKRNREKHLARCKAWRKANPDYSRRHYVNRDPMYRRAEARRRYLENQDAELERQRQWRADNRVMLREYHRGRWVTQGDKLRAQQRARYWKDPEKFRARSRKPNRTWDATPRKRAKNAVPWERVIKAKKGKSK